MKSLLVARRGFQRIRACLAAAILLNTGALLGADAGRAPAPVDLVPPASGTKVLLVTGIDYPGHKWRETAPVLKRLLEEDRRLRVRIVEQPEALASPKLQEWDTVILHFQNWETPGPGTVARANLRRFVASGKGMMLTHFACGAWYGEWPGFERLAGRVWFGPDGGRQHDPRGVFTVEMADGPHPITAGLESFDTLDELYTCLEGETPIRVLARARSKVDQQYYPMVFVHDYCEGRVFHSVLGHDVTAYTHSRAVGELMRRGCAWVSGLPPAGSDQESEDSPRDSAN
jgi:type 1 glutamine amidotransferase